MQTTPKISFLLVLAGLIGIYTLSTHLTNERAGTYEITTETRMNQKYKQSFGMDKFWADINWMRVIQEMGDMRKALTPLSAKFFAEYFDTITDLDPDFKKAYKQGFHHISHQLPEKALALLEKANTYSTKGFWEYSWLAGNWKERLARSEKDPEKKKALYVTAQNHFEKALKAGGQPWYVERGLLRLQVKIQGTSKNSLDEVKAWYAYYNNSITAAKKEQLTSNEGDQSTTMNPQDDISSTNMETDVPADKEWLRDLIKVRCRKHTQELLVKETLSATDKKSRSYLLETFSELSKNNEHFSPISLEYYEKGDLFDAMTGSPVTPYGIDLWDYEVNGRITDVRGTYNTLTGKRAAKTFAELKTLLGAQKMSRLSAHTPEAIAAAAKK